MPRSKSKDRKHPRLPDVSEGVQDARDVRGGDEYIPYTVPRVLPEDLVAGRGWMVDHVGAAVATLGKLCPDGYITHEAVNRVSAVIVADRAELIRFLEDVCSKEWVVSVDGGLDVVSVPLSRGTETSVLCVPRARLPAAYPLSNVMVGGPFSTRVDVMYLHLAVFAFNGLLVGLAAAEAAPLADTMRTEMVGISSPLQATVAMEALTGISRASPAFVAPLSGHPIRIGRALQTLAALTPGVTYATEHPRCSAPDFVVDSIHVTRA